MNVCYSQIHLFRGHVHCSNLIRSLIRLKNFHVHAATVEAFGLSYVVKRSNN